MDDNAKQIAFILGKGQAHRLILATLMAHALRDSGDRDGAIRSTFEYMKRTAGMADHKLQTESQRPEIAATMMESMHQELALIEAQSLAVPRQAPPGLDD